MLTVIDREKLHGPRHRSHYNGSSSTEACHRANPLKFLKNLVYIQTLPAKLAECKQKVKRSAERKED